MGITMGNNVHKEAQTNWAKTFDTQYGQVLTYYEFDPEEENYVFHKIIKTPECELDAKISSKNEDVAIRLFDKFSDQKHAEEFAKAAFEFAEDGIIVSEGE